MNRPEFDPYGPAHLAALTVVAGLAGGLWAAGRRVRREQRPLLARAVACLLLAYTVAAYTALGRQGLCRWDSALPLHLCNAVLLCCLAGLVTPHPLLFEIAYFWGLAGAVAAMLTPDLASGWPSWAFVDFFWGHGCIVLSNVTMMAVLGLRPRPGAVPRMMGALALYAGIVGTLDAAFGWNYGYLLRKPARPTLMDHLGPWPWYLFSAGGLALVMFWLLDRPWRGRTGCRPRTLRPEEGIGRELQGGGDLPAGEGPASQEAGGADPKPGV